MKTVRCWGPALLATAVSVSADKEKPLKDEGLASLVSMIRPDMKFGCHMGFKLQNDWDSADKERAVIIKEFNVVSTGIYQKSTERTAGTWMLSDVDRSVEFAAAHNQAIYFHPMFGQNLYNPPWLLEANYTDRQIRAYMDQRIEKLAKRYADTVTYLDVYNELIKNEWPDPGNPWKEEGTGAIYPTALEHLFQQLGSRTMGGFTWPVALEEAFVKCRKAFGPDVKLIYNEAYNVNADHTQSLGCIALFNAFKARGIPIDGIGIQLHMNIGHRGKEDHLRVGAGGEQGPLDFESFSLNMERLAATGAEIYITECDVNLKGRSSKEELLRWQGEVYVEALERCLDQPACKLFKIWGTSDRYSWKGMDTEAMLWDFDCEPKPAYFALKKKLIERVQKKACLAPRL
ncbi:endo-1,4-beta-xylanase [Pontiella agarivorans]|uniref:endo-1,4-beta-xylanase n=1 Tax=Pontiella agarivorans TaxID=3038953 RepID=A0ABU5MY12_9BACT|nr:endo-1,4-beta-xylanase [Pontiella agarivorans]MDZ8119073.1 endo-1,4-beta-xylanase [Pontiella agarivorans]